MGPPKTREAFARGKPAAEALSDSDLSHTVTANVPVIDAGRCVHGMPEELARDRRSSSIRREVLES